jgi:hypothetical protein
MVSQIIHEYEPQPDEKQLSMLCLTTRPSIFVRQLPIGYPGNGILPQRESGFPCGSAKESGGFSAM